MKTPRIARAAVLLGLFLPAPAPAAAAPDPGPFRTGAVWSIRLDIPAPGMESLRRQPRDFVTATFREGTQSLSAVAVRLKGSLGSFQPIDDKPSFTLDFAQRVDGQHWQGLHRVQLNNSVEDATFLHEQLGSSLFQAAGVPAPRVAHALVDLNGRSLGLYVIKEGFDAPFLARHFARADGVVFEGNPDGGRDVDEPMPHSGGGGGEAGRKAGRAGETALGRLAAAVRETDAAVRWRRLGETLDRDRFLTFLAMETLLAHRDGYGAARNNFRVYHDPGADRLVFLPDGMDQLLGRGSWPIQPEMAGVAARALLETPAGRAAYRERLGTLFTNHFAAASLSNTVQGWAAALAPSLPAADGRALRAAAVDLGERLQKRAVDVARQLAVPPPAPIEFTNGLARLAQWRPVDVPAGGALDQGAAPDGRAALRIQAGAVTTASWRMRVWLLPGRYRLEGRARTVGVKPMPYGRTQGASLAVSGKSQGALKSLVGDSDWTALSVSFAMEGRGTEVDLMCALRASAGQAWFDLASLQLVRE